MKSKVEFRNQAWKRLWTDHWFGRLFGGWILLALCGYAFNVVLGGILGQLGIEDWQDYFVAVKTNSMDLTTPVPILTKDYVVWATAATILELFIGYIMAGIAAYGCAVILLRCLKNEENGWLRSAFGGFGDPFGMLWLMVRLMLIYLGWGLFLVIPPLGIWLLTVAFYRYRFVWLIKAEHPDWSAGECLRVCRRMTNGHKAESFMLDCSYWKPITAVLLLLLCAATAICTTILFKDQSVLAVLLGLCATAALLVGYAGVIVLGQYISVGQGLFYQDLKASCLDGR